MNLPRRYLDRLRRELEPVAGALPSRYPRRPWDELGPSDADVESNVLDFPTRNAPPPEPEVPVEHPNYDASALPQRLTPQNQQAITRPRVVTPTDASTATDDVTSAGESQPTRPRLAYPKGTVEYQDKLLTDLENNTPEKLSRGKSAKYGFLRGLQTGGLGGGLIGAAVGAIAPGATSDMKQRDEIKKATNKLDTAITREGKLSVIEERRRQPEKEYQNYLRQEREKRIANVMTMHDRLGHYNPDDPNDRGSQIIKAQAKALGIDDELVPYTKAGSAPPHADVDGVRFERQADGSWKAATGLPTRTMVNVPGYGPMTPAQARNADALEGQRTYQRGRDTFEDQRHEVERQENRRQMASRIAGEVADHNAEAAKWKDLAARTTDPTNKDYYESQMLGEKQKANAKALELSQGYGDIYEAGPGEEGWAYVKQKPQAQSLPTRGKGKNRRTYSVDPSKYGLP